MILVTENVGEDGISLIRSVLVGDETHCNAGNRLLDLHSGIHQGKTATAYGSH